MTSTWERMARLADALAPQAQDPSPLAAAALRRQAPEVGAVCGKPARTVLCGGRPVMGVPTAIVSDERGAPEIDGGGRTRTGSRNGRAESRVKERGCLPELRRWTWRTRAAGRVGVALGAQPGRRPARPDGDGRGCGVRRSPRRKRARRSRASRTNSGRGGRPTSGRPRPGAGVHRGGEPVGMRRARARGMLLWISMPPVRGGYVPQLSLPTTLGRGDNRSRRSLPKG